MIDVVVLFFLLGLAARLVRSDLLRLPEALYETLSIYLLLTIGMKGGIELAERPFSTLWPEILAALGMSFLIPPLIFPLLRWLRFSGTDAGALAGHYGSVSVVTFAVVTAELHRRGIAYEAHAPLWVALMEAPGIVAGILLARMAAPEAVRWGPLMHEVLFGKSIFLLGGGLLIGTVAGREGLAPIATVFIEPFKGVLALFLLELGLLTGGKWKDIQRFGLRLILVGTLLPLLLSLVGATLGILLGLSRGGVAIFATLAASASYIAAPTAIRIAVPEANAGLSISAALGVTFPFNLLVGIPIHIAVSGALVEAFGGG